MRARNLKPGFFINERLAELKPLTRLLFAGLWTIADREGRLEDRPKRIKATLLPYDNCDVHAMLQQLHATPHGDETEEGFIIRYTVDGKALIQITNFKEHQNPHLREPQSVLPAINAPDAATEAAPNKHAPSTVPAPVKHSASTVPAPVQHQSGPAPSPFPLPLTPSPLPRAGAREGEVGGEAALDGEAAPTAGPGDYICTVLKDFKGKRLRDLPEDKLIWLANNSKRPDEQAAADAYLRQLHPAPPPEPDPAAQASRDAALTAQYRQEEEKLRSLTPEERRVLHNAQVAAARKRMVPGTGALGDILQQVTQEEQP